jgi:predicted enzyme related to lactoylglutathione lyase
MGYPVVHFEINTNVGPELARFYADAFGWTTQPDGDDYVQIKTNGVCAGTGAPGIDGGIGPSDPGDDFVTFYVQVRSGDAGAGRPAWSGSRHAPDRGGSHRLRDLSRPGRQSHWPRPQLSQRRR